MQQSNVSRVKTIKTKPQQNNKPAHADKCKAWERIGDKRKEL